MYLNHNTYELSSGHYEEHLRENILNWNQWFERCLGFYNFSSGGHSVSMMWSDMHKFKGNLCVEL